MVKPASYDSNGMKKGAWSEDEDNKLKACIKQLGRVPNWRLLPLAAGLKRCGKSCRLRWLNYLMPGLKKEKITKHEEDLIIQLHNKLGNKWSAIAAHFPGRTDNDIKNYWHAHIQKRRDRVAREIRARSFDGELRNEQEQSSDTDSSSSCVTDEKQEVVFQEGLSAEYAGSDINAAVESLRAFNLPPLFEEEELCGFGLWPNDIISDDADAARFFEQEPVGEEFFSLGLWDLDETNFVFGKASYLAS